MLRTSVVPAPAGRKGPNARQKPGRNGVGTVPPEAGAPKITKTTTTTRVPAAPSTACSPAVANATAAITSVNAAHSTKNFELGSAPSTGPAIRSVTKAPTTDTHASDARRRLRCVGG